MVATTWSWWWPRSHALVSSIFSRSLYSLDTSGSVERPEAAEEGGDRGKPVAGGKGKSPKAAAADVAEDCPSLVVVSGGLLGASGANEQSQLFCCLQKRKEDGFCRKAKGIYRLVGRRGSKADCIGAREWPP